MNKSFLIQFATDICEFIHFNDYLEDKDNNLIMDYVEALYNKGVDLRERDYEKEIYIFYNYHDKYNVMLHQLGEEEFIDIITSAEIFKMKLLA